MTASREAAVARARNLHTEVKVEEPAAATTFPPGGKHVRHRSAVGIAGVVLMRIEW